MINLNVTVGKNWDFTVPEQIAARLVRVVGRNPWPPLLEEIRRLIAPLPYWEQIHCLYELGIGEPARAISRATWHLPLSEAVRVRELIAEATAAIPLRGCRTLYWAPGSLVGVATHPVTSIRLDWSLDDWRYPPSSWVDNPRSVPALPLRAVWWTDRGWWAAQTRETIRIPIPIISGRSVGVQVEWDLCLAQVPPEAAWLEVVLPGAPKFHCRWPL